MLCYIYIYISVDDVVSSSVDLEVKIIRRVPVRQIRLYPDCGIDSGSVRTGFQVGIGCKLLDTCPANGHGSCIWNRTMAGFQFTFTRLDFFLNEPYCFFAPEEFQQYQQLTQSGRGQGGLVLLSTSTSTKVMSGVPTIIWC